MMSQFRDRIRGRIKYGLLTQEILDRAGRLGLRVIPYVIVDESHGVTLGIEPGPPNCAVRQLTIDDMPQVANMPGRERDLNKTLARLDDAECLGLFVNGKMAGYTWSRSDRIVHTTKVVLHELQPDEAYLFDIYIDKAFRGLGIARVLRQELYRHLAAKDVKRFYSISAYFNRSTRKFKARLGARELELRLVLKLRSLIAADLRLKRYKEDCGLKTKRFYLVRN